MKKSKLPTVIAVDEERCVNCFACITVCPVKYCNDASGTTVTIDPDLCIGCGACIEACTHNARLRVDDSAAFFQALGRGEKIVAIAAPAVVSSYPKTYLRLNGYLNAIGVSAVFDVSFGAELTVKSYVTHIKENSPKMVIAQPCPTLVSYMEIYRPELLPYLAPADSPMAHTMKMIREFYPAYRGHSFAVLSPCLAKRREFDDIGIGDYNVTLASLQKHLEEKKVNLASFPEVEFANPPAERAVLFSSPGGLLRTAEREVPGLALRARKIEGPQTIYHYLDQLPGSVEKGINPLLVDCLNCEKGCNGGPGTINQHKSPDELEYPIEQRRVEMMARYKPRFRFFTRSTLGKTLSRFWKKDLYARTYNNLSQNNYIKQPSPEEARRIYESMRKFKDTDHYNCGSCGYGSCEKMVVAIFNGLNKPENCHHFTLELLKGEQKRIESFNKSLSDQIGDALSFIEKISALVEELNVKIGSQSASLEESSAAIEQMMASIGSTSQVSQKKREGIRDLVENAVKGQESMNETIQSVRGIAKSVDAIADTMEMIEGIASNTNLLSMNAAIEAAHAGEAGKGFAVVADEIRRLSEATRENSQNISRTLSGIIEGIALTSRRSTETDALIRRMASEISGFTDTMSELINTFSELSTGSTQITTALMGLKTLSMEIKDSYGDMLEMTLRLRGTMTELAEASAKNVATFLGKAG
ncbi:hypothetical protein MASR2M29_15370 [Spirochaetota bacterium]